MHPAADPDAVHLRVLQGAGGFNRAPSRQLALGGRPLAARAFRNPLSSADHGGDKLRPSENDATPCGGRSQPAENDAVYAAHVPLFLLVLVERSGVILAHWQHRWGCPAVVF